MFLLLFDLFISPALRGIKNILCCLISFCNIIGTLFLYFWSILSNRGFLNDQKQIRFLSIGCFSSHINTHVMFSFTNPVVPYSHQMIQGFPHQNPKPGNTPTRLWFGTWCCICAHEWLSSEGGRSEQGHPHKRTLTAH